MQKFINPSNNPNIIQCFQSLNQQIQDFNPNNLYSITIQNDFYTKDLDFQFYLKLNQNQNIKLTQLEQDQINVILNNPENHAIALNHVSTILETLLKNNNHQYYRVTESRIDLDPLLDNQKVLITPVYSFQFGTNNTDLTKPIQAPLNHYYTIPIDYPYMISFGKKGLNDYGRLLNQYQAQPNPKTLIPVFLFQKDAQTKIPRDNHNELHWITINNSPDIQK